jgi:hypothetical protein
MKMKMKTKWLTTPMQSMLCLILRNSVVKIQRLLANKRLTDRAFFVIINT